MTSKTKLTIAELAVKFRKMRNRECIYRSSGFVAICKPTQLNVTAEGFGAFFKPIRGFKPFPHNPARIALPFFSAWEASRHVTPETWDAYMCNTTVHYSREAVRAAKTAFKQPINKLVANGLLTERDVERYTKLYSGNSAQYIEESLRMIAIAKAID